MELKTFAIPSEMFTLPIKTGSRVETTMDNATVYGVVTKITRAALEAALGRKVSNAEQNAFVLHINRASHAWLENEAKAFAAQKLIA